MDWVLKLQQGLIIQCYWRWFASLWVEIGNLVTPNSCLILLTCHLLLHLLKVQIWIQEYFCTLLTLVIKSHHPSFAIVNHKVSVRSLLVNFVLKCFDHLVMERSLTQLPFKLVGGLDLWLNTVVSRHQIWCGIINISFQLLFKIWESFEWMLLQQSWILMRTKCWALSFKCKSFYWRSIILLQHKILAARDLRFSLVFSRRNYFHWGLEHRARSTLFGTALVVAMTLSGSRKCLSCFFNDSWRLINCLYLFRFLSQPPKYW